MGKINLVRPDGKVVSATPQDAQLLIGLGYRPEAPEEAIDRAALAAKKAYYSTAGQQVLAAGEGLLSGLDPTGLAEMAMADEATRARAEFNPGTRTAGELIGMFAPALLTGGESLVAKGLSRAPSAALARGATSIGERLAGKGVLGRTAGFAIEGAALGAGGEVKHAALSGDPLTAEQVLAGMKLGGMLGAGAGVLAGGMEKAAAWARARAMPEVSQLAMVDEIGKLGPFQGPVYRPQNVRPLAGEFEANMPRPPRWDPAIEGRTPSVIVEGEHAPSGLRERADWVKSQAADALVPTEQMNRFAATVGDLESKAASLEKTLQKAQATHLKDVGDALQAHVMLVGPNPEAVAGLRTMRSRYRAMVDNMDNPARFEEAASEYQSTLKSLSDATGYNMDAHPSPIRGVSHANFADHVAGVKDLRQAVKTLHQSGPVSALDMFGMRTARRERVEAAIDLVMSSKLPDAVPLQQALGGVIDDMAAGMGMEYTGSVASKFRAMTEHGGESLASAEITTMGTGIKQHPKVPYAGGAAKTPEDMPVDLGQAHPIVKDEAAPIAERVAKSARYEADHRTVEMASGLPPSNRSLYRLAKWSAVNLLLGAKAAAGYAVAQAAKRLVTLERVAKAATGVGKVVGTVTPKAPALAMSITGRPDSEGDLRKRFASRSAELRQLQFAGRNQAFAFAQELAGAGHSEAAFAVYQAAVRAQDAIVERVPKDPPGTRWGTEWLWKAPAEQVEVFAQEYAAAFDPLEFIQQASADPESVYPQAVRTLEKAYPNLYAQFQAEALVQLAQTGTKGMTPVRLQALSTILGVPLSPTSEPSFVAAQQAMYMPQNQPPPPPTSGTNSGPPGRPPGADATASQRLNNR